MLKERLQKRFEEIYGGGGEIRVFFAPGRVTLIGEHIDCYGGHAFSFATREGTYCAVRKRADRTMQLASLNMDGGRVHGFLSGENSVSRESVSWVRYPYSVIRLFMARGIVPPQGMDVLYSGDLAMGVGLASSASIEVVTAKMLLETAKCERVSDEEIAGLFREAQHGYVADSSGLHDYFTSIFGKEGCGLLIGAGKMTCEYIPLELGSARVVLTDSGVRHGERSSAFQERRQECGKALKKLKAVANIDELCDLSVDTFNNCKDVIMNDVYMRRARHAVTENARCIRAVSALRVGNIRRVGELMNRSHESLRDDYDVSCPELDFLVDAGRRIPGVLGLRMMGCGFGGCTVGLVEEECLDSYRASITEAYRDKYNITPGIFTAGAGDGVREL